MVARLIQSAAANNAAIIANTKARGSAIWNGSMISLATVVTTSPPAINAPAVSKIAAMISAPAMVSALEPTAGATLLATSLAPMLSAM